MSYLKRLVSDSVGVDVLVSFSFAVHNSQHSHPKNSLHSHPKKQRFLFPHVFKKFTECWTGSAAGTSQWKTIAQENCSPHGNQEAEREKGGAGDRNPPFQAKAPVATSKKDPRPKNIFSQNSPMDESTD